jgi:hypothetical protein
LDREAGDRSLILVIRDSRGPLPFFMPFVDRSCQKWVVESIPNPQHLERLFMRVFQINK